MNKSFFILTLFLALSLTELSANATLDKFCKNVKLQSSYLVSIDNENPRHSLKISRNPINRGGLLGGLNNENNEVAFDQYLMKGKSLIKTVLNNPTIENFTETFIVLCDQSEFLQNPTVQITPEVRFNIPSYFSVDGFFIQAPLICEGGFVDSNIEGTCRSTVTSPPINYPEEIEQPESKPIENNYSFKATPIR